MQWLDFHRYGGDFYANFSELIQTLNTDREYVREHTKILYKALEWKQRNKTIDLLLRGSEYTRAYEWLKLAIAKYKQPPVTKDMKEFILKSKPKKEFILKSKPKVEQLPKSQQKTNNIIFRALEAIALTILILSSWQLSTQRFLIEYRVLVQAMYREFTHQVDRKNSPPVMLVEIDANSFRKAKIAKIIDKLTTINTKIIGFDYVFDRYQPENDKKFAQSLRSSIEKQNTWFVFATIGIQLVVCLKYYQS